MINHLEPLDWGEITVDGRHVGYQRAPSGGLRLTGNPARAHAEAGIGMGFRHFNLFEHLTAPENLIEASIQVYRRPPEQARAIGLQLLAGVGLAHHVDDLPHRLSGGQQQRVASARAIAVSPRVILVDEPTSALDPELVGEVLGVIRGLAEAGMIVIIVTHEVGFARDVVDRIVFMDDGVIVEEGPPGQVLDQPGRRRADGRVHADGSAVHRPAWRTVSKFNEAISFQIPVETEAEADRLADALSAVPKAEQCGWVKERLGVSWQIVPRQLTRLIGHPDPARARRVFDAMMQMKRIDIAALERGADGVAPSA
jgi:ABC-type polar amino acid transport system ATPase subunit